MNATAKGTERGHSELQCDSIPVDGMLSQPGVYYLMGRVSPRAGIGVQVKDFGPCVPGLSECERLDGPASCREWHCTGFTAGTPRLVSHNVNVSLAPSTFLGALGMNFGGGAGQVPDVARQALAMLHLFPYKLNWVQQDQTMFFKGF